MSGGKNGLRFWEAVALSFPILCGLATLAGIVMLFTVGISTVDLVLLTVSFLLCSVGVHAGFHRLFSHGSFKTHRVTRYTLAVLGTMAGEGPVISWVAIHRRHHQSSAQPDDPHTPNQSGSLLRGFFHAQLGWLFGDEYRGPKMLSCAINYTPDLVREKPLAAISRWYFPIVLLGVLIPGLIGGWLSGGWGGFLSGMFWGGLVRSFLVLNATQSINSLGHLFGRQPFRSNDRSTNNAFVSLVTLGEGWHNNHHAFPSSAIQGLRWWQLDPQAWCIRLLQLLGLAWDVRRPTPEQVAAKRRA